jgi:hypothetical protein
MRIGITGTRDGMTLDQEYRFQRIIIKLDIEEKITEYRGGDCIGVDDETTYLMYDYSMGNLPIIEKGNLITNGKNPIKLICHPPLKEDLRAWNPHYDLILPAKSYFARNRDIVDNSDVVIVIPKQMSHQTYGGTWQAHDYAVKKGKRVIIIWPDGTVRE